MPGMSTPACWIHGSCQQPCTTRDFMNYLIHVERSAENLQFYLWFRDYNKRFAALPPSDSVLSPECRDKNPADVDSRPRHSKAPKPLDLTVADVLKDGDLKPPLSANPFDTPPPSPNSNNGSIPSSAAEVSSRLFGSEPVSTLHSNTAARKLAAEAFEGANRLQPCTLNRSSPGRIQSHTNNSSYCPTIPTRNRPHYNNLHQAQQPAPSKPD